MSKAKIHPTAVVDPKAEIDGSCEIGPYCVIGPKVKLGARTRLLSHVVVDNRTTIGEGNVFYPFSTIGVAPADLKYNGEDTELVIGDENTIRESVSLHTGTAGGGGVTKIGNKNLIMAYTHFGHDCIVENNVVIANGCQIAGHVTIEDWAIVGGLTGISQFVRIGEHSYVGGCSGVDRDVAPFALGKGPTGSFQIMGLNLVGLRRRGFSPEVLSALVETGKLFFKSPLEKAEALKQIEATHGQIAEVKRFCEFLKKTEVGVYR